MTRSLEDITKAEEEFSRYYQKLRKELNLAYWHFRLIEYIKEIQIHYDRELKQTPSFWGLTIHAHMVATLSRLNNLFGKKGKEKHLHMYSFLAFIEENLDIFSNENFERRLRDVNRYDELAANHNCEITNEKIKQDIRKLSNLPISGLKAWRNKILSHIDKDSVAKAVDIGKRHPIKMKHIAQIINTLHVMLNEYSLEYDFSTYDKGLSDVEIGLQYILDAVRRNLRR